MLPDTFSEDRQTMAYRRIPRVVGGKVVPNLTSLTQAPANRAARRSIGAQKWNPSAPVIHEGFVKHDPLPRPRGGASVFTQMDEYPETVGTRSNMSILLLY